MSLNKFKNRESKSANQKVSNNVFMLYFTRSEELCDIFVLLLKLGSQVQQTIKSS